ncbi:MAG: sensor domain-containing diguanylate cyclase [Actinomycetota bacterium]
MTVASFLAPTSDVRLLSELAATATRLGRPTTAAMVLVTPVIAALSWPTDRPVLLAAWVLAMVTVTTYLGTVFLRANPSDGWIGHSLLAHTLAGLGLGVSPALAAAEQDLAAHNGATVAALCAATGGSIVAHAAIPRIAQLFIPAIWLAATPILVLNGLPLLAIGGASFAVIALWYNANAHRVLRDSIEHRLDAARLAEELTAAEARTRAVIDTIGDAIWTLDRRGVVVEANPAAVRLAGDDVAGRRIDEVVVDLDLAAIGVQQERTIESETDERHVIVSVSLVPGVGYTVAATDISKLKRLERQLAHQATHDQLTGLSNRHGLVTHLAALRASSTRYVVLYCDLDGFKDVNDRFGHPVGDEVLDAIAVRIRSEVRRVDLVSRLGGDEFVVVLIESNVADALELGGRVISAVERPLVARGIHLRLSVSVGVAPGLPGSDPDGVLEQADAALYEAKHQGGGQSIEYHPTMRSALAHPRLHSVRRDA